MRQYSHGQTFLANVPYGLMVVLGAVVLGHAFAFSSRGGLAAAGYLAYGVGGALWIMVFVCPFCGYYGTRGCPCGYGLLAERLVRKGALECFAGKFKRHIPVIVPLWLVPPIAAAVALSRHPSRSLMALLVAFVINSFVVLPLVSRRHSCSECPQRDGCPWMSPP